MKKRKLTTKLLSCALVFSVTVSGLSVNTSTVPAFGAETTQLTKEELTEALGSSETSRSRVSVHDPSIVQRKGTNEYYVFGSHLAVAKTSDLSNWEYVYGTENDKTSALFGNAAGQPISWETAFESNAYNGKVNVAGGEVDFGTYNAEKYVTGATDTEGLSGNFWAPDVIYNTAMNKYCMYLSLNGANNTQQSAIVLLTADEIAGPYVYQGPVVYTRVSGDASAATSWTQTDMPLVYGQNTTFPARYANESAGDWANYYPHAIDPAVFYDEAGKLWMVYGSWSGGIYMLELDENTGLRDYTVSYVDANVNNGITDLTTTKENFGKKITADPYYGKKVAGGYYVSGEGPYIEYIDGKYYLFMSYGEYAPTGNYQMRIFSSASPDGPYVDTAGVSAIYDQFTVNFNAAYGGVYEGTDMGAPGTTRGSRLMSNYQWSTMEKGETSQGHNSAITIGDKSYVVYHTKLNDGTLTHEVRVHELFTVDGCLIAAPYEYDPAIEQKGSYAKDDVAASYDVIVQGYDTNKRYDPDTQEALAGATGLECETPSVIEFKEDGKVVKGETEVGTWSLANQNELEVTLTSAIDEGKAAYTDTLAGTYKGYFMEQNVAGSTKTCFSAINKATGISIWGTMGVTPQQAIALTEKNMKVSIPASTRKNITLPTEGMSGATISWKSSNTEVLSNDGVVTTPKQDTKVTLTQTISCGSYYYETSYDVVVRAEDAGAIDLSSIEYVQMKDNQFFGRTLDTLYIKYTINWAENSVKTGWDGLFSFYNSGTTGRVSVQSAPYICYNQCVADGKWVDFNQPVDTNNTTNAYLAEKGKDYTYEIIISRSNGVSMYEDGKEITYATNGSATAADILDYIVSCDKFSWGTYGTGFWGTEICTLSNVVIADTIPVEVSYEQEYELSYGMDPIISANPYRGYHDITKFEGEYTVNYDSYDAYHALFGFVNDSTTGRISFHGMPYICYNECTSDDRWIDIKTDGASFSTGENHTVKFCVTESEVRFFVDDVEIENINLSGDETFRDLLNYLGECDSFVIGVPGFWGAANATVSDISFYVEGKCDLKTFDMSKVEWSKADFTYDGKEKKVELKGLPEGLTATYTGNTATDAGDYVAKVVFEYDKTVYADPVFEDLAYNWTIKQAEYDMSKVKWTAENFEYDGKEKTVELTGLPDGVKAAYEGNKATEAGAYTAKVVLTSDNANYKTPAAVADLNWKITAKDTSSSEKPSEVNPPVEKPSEVNPPAEKPSEVNPPAEVPSVSVPKNVGTVVKDSTGSFKVVDATQGDAKVEYTAPVSKKTKKVTVPDVVTVDGVEYKVTKVADNAFKKNSTITSVKIGENVTEIGKSAFSGCTKLKTVKLNSNLTKINKNAFYGCKTIKSIIIPKNVKEIGTNAFYGCKNLKQVTIKSTKLTKIGSRAFKGIKSSARFKVPSKKYNAYKKLLKNKIPSKALVKK